MNIKTDELRNIQKYIVKALIRSKLFDRYRFDGCFQLLFDGTGLSNHDYNLNNNYLIRKHRDGKISYYKYVLECKLIVGNIVISLDSEFIENEKMPTDKQKQDCETKAFKRVIKRIKKNYPKYKFIITGDVLYATLQSLNYLKNLKFLYPNPTLFITFILLFNPSVNPFENLLSMNEFTIYGNQLLIVLDASSNSNNSLFLQISIHSFISSSACS